MSTLLSDAVSASARSKPAVVERSVPFAPPELCIRRLNTSPTISQLSGEAEEEAMSATALRSGAGAGAVVTVPVAVTKQANGFGFTLADQVGGQRVKEVLEPTGLRVGDVILEVNGKWVKEASHLEVVQLLKTCSIGKTSNFLIQRVLPISVDKKHMGASVNSNFTSVAPVNIQSARGRPIGAQLVAKKRVPDCDSPLSFDGADINDFSPTSALYSTFHPADYNMLDYPFLSVPS
ncbi:Membrane-associated guanylate kinase, WW and PDZ domain-containing protein 2 [Echinococcus granulosus]|uniref:Membrane-associated guanylate kinase, WW and PDZ domain-containing protein 2 n=1 Tax=Echinococcus granulosus TaxID=6210 RepID=W6V2C9_ECHGR|nr:Membrane-associated guanylate kinase, WW and PDZ domain-containing protein 2 [Echinococcus granulosus]EUB60064.1 Membrane-associated guanylate kinase, WW and PDZ domain-containing protein 2 [Echinococcus granulosus]